MMGAKDPGPTGLDDSESSRRRDTISRSCAYETPMPPWLVAVVAGLGVEPSSLLASGYEPDRHTVAGSLRRSRAESNGIVTLRKRDPRSTSESSGVPRRSRTFASWFRKPAAGSAGRDMASFVRESGHRDSNSAGTAWKAGFSPREMPANGRRYSHRRSRYFHDRRSPLQESNLSRSNTNGGHDHRAERASQRQDAGESNAVPRIWNPFGHHGPHPVAPRSGNDPLSPLGQRGCDTCRITRHQRSRRESNAKASAWEAPRARAWREPRESNSDWLSHNQPCRPLH